MPKRKRDSPTPTQGNVSDRRKVSTRGNTSIQALADEERESISSPLTPTDYEKTLATRPNTTTRNLVNKGPRLPILGAACTLISSEGHPVADLDKYIEEAYYPYGIPSSRRPIFNHGTGHFRPQLEQCRMNRIIVYPGCFNPPHRGHQALINRAFSCTRDINVIAAIIVPVTGQRKQYTDDVWFEKAQRIQLWTGNQGPHDWLWFYERRGREWDEFQERLISAVKRDGFHLEFILLCGPDNVDMDHMSPKDDIWGCKNIIVSDVGRAASFVRANGKLTRLSTCTAWEPVSIDPREIVRKSTDTAEWILSSLSLTMSGQKTYGALIEEIGAEYANRMRGVALCRHRRAAHRWIRYVPDVDGMMQMSSTDIRRTIARCPVDQLSEKLKGKALHPELLVQFVRENKTGTS
ncbi:hypothetical protein Hte_005938 [Hypoxylon texense]